MITRAALEAMTPAQRARVIYTETQSELESRLWRAALGDTTRGAPPVAEPRRDRLPGESLLQLLAAQEPGSARAGCVLSDADDGDAGSVTQAAPVPAAQAAGTRAIASGAGSPGPCVLGANARFQQSVTDAARATGVPAAAIAAIIDAEAAKNRDGSWNAHSRNPRSSAAGLGQFLSGTWQGLAETGGTWLNATARAQGWLDARGKVRAGARAALLSLRYDADASIRTVADFARGNLDRLEKAGIAVHDNVRTIARAAYLSHNLGIGDARRFLSGAIQPDRARMLLHAQIGAGNAERRISDAGSATEAHRQWLLAYIEKNVHPERFVS